MSNQLFVEIEKFDQWAQSWSDVPQDERGGEWECGYKNWRSIYDSFDEFVRKTDPKSLTSAVKERLLYIIARDNEIERLSKLLDESFLVVLTEHSILYGHRDDKWQLAVQLYKLADRSKALTLLERLVNDDDEYVNRLSLMELARLKSDQVERYAESFWHKDRYGEMEEYQKIAVLHALKMIDSKLLPTYLELAKQSGQQHLVHNALQISSSST